MRNRNWIVNEIDESLVYEIKKKFGLKDPIIRLLLDRGLKTEQELDDFLNPTLARLPNPNLLTDLKKGAQRVVQAILDGEKITVYGDYDADGVTACALVYLFLKEVGANVDYYIPDRFEDGYSLNKKAIDELKGKGTSLIITVDCGISDDELVEYGNSIGLEFIITDHHNVPKNLPKAVAVINPKRSDCSFPFKELAGVGVAFYLVIKVRKILREAGFFTKIREPNLKSYLDLVAIGTVSDMVPLLGPNRIFVRYGLDELTKNNRPGLKALLEELGIENIDTRLISFRITPRLNAPGRMSTPKHAFELLISRSEEKAKELVKTLNMENQRRQKEEEKVINSALKMLPGDSQMVYVAYDPNWHPGVLGIVASKLLERFERPFFLFTDDREGLLRGSGRSIEGIPIIELLREMEDLLIEYGGHDLACGLIIRKEDLPQFIFKINELAMNYFSSFSEIKYKISSILSLTDIDNRFFQELFLLEPFGKGNPEPIFLMEDLIIESVRFVGSKENHLKLVLKKNGQSFSSIGFFMTPENIKENCRIDIVGMPRMNEFNGTRYWDFILKDYFVYE